MEFLGCGSTGKAEPEFVVRGPAWKRDEDGGPGNQGIVRSTDEDLVEVEWEASKRKRWHHKSDLAYATDANKDASNLVVHDKVVRGANWKLDEDGTDWQGNVRLGWLKAEHAWRGKQVLWLDGDDQARWYRDDEVQKAQLSAEQLQQARARLKALAEFGLGDDEDEAKPQSVRFVDGLYDVPYQKLCERLVWVLSVTLGSTITCIAVNVSWVAMKHHKGHCTLSFSTKPLLYAGLFAAACQGVILVWKFRLADKKAASDKSEDAKKPIRATPTRRWTSFCLSVMLMGVLPTFFLNSTLQWWVAAVDAHNYCASQCYAAHDGAVAETTTASPTSPLRATNADSNTTHQDPEFHKVAERRRRRLDEEVEQYKSLCDAAALTKERTKIYENYEPVMLQAASDWTRTPVSPKCLNILSSTPPNNPYVKKSVEKGMSLLVFEALLRVEAEISVVEIYWAMPMSLCLVLWMCTDIALFRKNKDLVDCRSIFLKQQLLKTPEQIWRYYENFLLLQQLYTANPYLDPSSSSNFVLKMLSNLKVKMLSDRALLFSDKLDESSSSDNALGNAARSKRLEKMIVDEMEVVKDVNMDGSVDSDASAGCWSNFRGFFTNERICSAGLATACCIIHILTPFGYRMWNTEFRTSHTFMQTIFPRELVRAPLLMNMLVCNVACFCIYYSVFHALYGYRGKLSYLMSFDCLWRFPDESPLDMVEYENGSGLLKGLAKHIRRVRQDRYKTEDKIPFVKTFQEIHPAARIPEGSLYRLSLSNYRNYGDLVEEVKGMNQWLTMRQYLQIDSVDDRAAVELWALVLLATASFSGAVMIWNIFYGDTKRHSAAAQVMNFHCLIQFSFVCMLIAVAMSITLDFNLRFEQHSRQIGNVRECLKYGLHLSLVSRYRESKVEQKKHDMKPEKIEEEEAKLNQTIEADKKNYDNLDGFLASLATSLSLFDKPATICGFQVDSKVVGNFTTLTVGLATSQLYPIILGFVSNSVEKGD